MREEFCSFDFGTSRNFKDLSQKIGLGGPRIPMKGAQFRVFVGGCGRLFFILSGALGISVCAKKLCTCTFLYTPVTRFI